jgi:hypothetical protein
MEKKTSPKYLDAYNHLPQFCGRMIVKYLEKAINPI